MRISLLSTLRLRRPTMLNLRSSFTGLVALLLISGNGFAQALATQSESMWLHSKDYGVVKRVVKSGNK